MFATFLLGLTGSLGHCAGMCSGIALLLTRRRDLGVAAHVTLHLGRITTYGLLGAAGGAMGSLLLGSAGHMTAAMGHSSDLAGAPTPLARVQGLFAFIAAAAAVYMAVALLGWVPAPDRLLGGVARFWGRRVRALSPSPSPTLFRIFLLGLWWGLLPCGLVLTALLTATVMATPAAGFLAMLAFGLGTGPVPLAVGLSGRHLSRLPARGRLIMPYLAATIVFAFGLQLALRGLAAFDVVAHFAVGEVVLW